MLLRGGDDIDLDGGGSRLLRILEQGGMFEHVERRRPEEEKRRRTC